MFLKKLYSSNNWSTKFFLSTTQGCTGPNGEKINRYLYIDNVPDGSIPGVPAGLGITLSDFRGLVPGIITQLGRIDPTEIFTAFTSSDKLLCQPVTLRTIDVNNNLDSDTQYVATKDIENINPCNFVNTGVNPVTNASCKESFKLRGDNSLKMPKDDILRILIYSFGIVGLYILFCLLQKTGKRMMRN